MLVKILKIVKTLIHKHDLAHVCIMGPNEFVLWKNSVDIFMKMTFSIGEIFF